MFTGLIEEIGVIEKLSRGSKGAKLFVEKPISFEDIKEGDSISVNGACLTAAALNKKIMIFDVMYESLKRTNLGDLKKGDKVNLERALKVGERLGGHFVTGHIDFKAQIKSLEIKQTSAMLKIALPKTYKKYIVAKGSIAVDGISLTIGEVFEDNFVIYLIPYTLKKTTLGMKNKAKYVNIELDLLAKLVFKVEDKQNTSKMDMSFLREHGFLK